MLARPRPTVGSGCGLVATLALVALASLARADGTLVACWGSDVYGQSGSPAGSDSCVALALGAEHTVALHTSGAVLCWGSNEFGQGMTPPFVGACSTVGAGFDHSLAVTQSGLVRAWGRNDSGQCAVPTSLASALCATGGGRHSIALLANGSVVCWGADDLGQSTPPGSLPACSRIAAGRDHSVALTTDGRVICWGNTRTAITGPAKARAFLEAVLSGSDSVDILWCGDSNTGFNSGAGAPVSGWCDGVAMALTERGFRQYATPMLPVMPVGTTFGRWSQSWSMPEGTGWTGGADTAINESGVEHAPRDLAGMIAAGSTPGGPVIHPNGVPFDFAWVPAQTNRFYLGSSGVSIDAQSQMDVRGRLHYRMFRSQDSAPTPQGTYSPGWEFLSGVAITPPIPRSGAGPVLGWIADECTLQADPTRPLASIRATCAGGSYGQSFGIQGPMGFALHSVRRDGRGWATQPLNYHGGATMTRIAEDVMAMPVPSRQLWLHELLARQRASGGSGRVIVWIQGGINQDAGTPESWGTAVVAIKNALESAWMGMGQPLDDITFVAMVSHPFIENDGYLGALRAHARTLPAQVPNLTIVDLWDLVTIDEMHKNHWYDETALVHLSAAGYSALSGRLIDALLERISPTATPAALQRPGSCAAISATSVGTVALTSDGSVRYWGSPRGGLHDVPTLAVPGADIAGGGAHALVLTTIGGVVAWGSNTSGQASVPATLGDAWTVAAGGSHSGAIVDGLDPCPGDFNLDGVRDGSDLTAILSGWSRPDGDCTGDGTTDGLDLSYLLAGWGPCTGQ